MKMYSWSKSVMFKIFTFELDDMIYYTSYSTVHYKILVYLYDLTLLLIYTFHINKWNIILKHYILNRLFYCHK